MRLRGTRLTAIARAARVALRWDLDLDFLAQRFSTPVSFSRSSNATVFDSLGRRVWAPANLSPQSRITGSSGGTVTSSAYIGADGDAFSDFVGTGGAVAHIHSSWTLTIPAGFKFCSSVYLQANAGDFIQLLCSSPLATGYVNVQLSTLTVANFGGAEGAVTFDGGLYRLSITVTSLGGTGSGLVLAPADSLSTARNPTTIETCSWTVGMLQVEYADATTPKAPLRTAGAAYYGLRSDYYPDTLAPRGVAVEENRVNLTDRSNAWTASVGAGTITNNTTASAWGIPNDAHTLTDTLGASGFHLANSAGASISAGVHAISADVFAGTATRCQLAVSVTASNHYANFSLVGDGSVLVQSADGTASIRKLAGGWFRVSFVAYLNTVGAGTVFVAHINSDTAARLPAYAGVGLTVFVAYAQIERGAFPTSLIPTFGGAVTRTEDGRIQVPDFPPFNADGCGLFVEYEHGHGINTGTSLAGWTRGGASTSVDAFFCAGGFGSPVQRRIDTVVASVNSARVMGNDAPLTVSKVAGSYTAGRTIAAKNGVLTVAALSVGAPTLLTEFYCVASTTFNGWVRKVKARGKPITDAQLQSVTT